MKKQIVVKEVGVELVDSSLWSEESLRIPVPPPRQYKDIEYLCWRCRKESTFTAKEQKYAYEVKKRYFWQRRDLCGNCWAKSNELKNDLKVFEKQWLNSKNQLTRDKEYLSKWLNFLIELEKYIAYKPDIAKKNMLIKLMQKDV